MIPHTSSKIPPTLSSILLRLHQSLNPEEILQTAATDICQGLECDRVAICCGDPYRNRRVALESVRYADGSIVACPLRVWDIGNATEIQTIRDIHCRELFADDRPYRNRISDGIADLSIPIFGKNSENNEKSNCIIGELRIEQERAPRQWQQREITFLEEISAHLAIAIQKAFQIEQLQTPRNSVAPAKDLTQRQQAEQERDRFFTLSLDMLCIAGFDGYFKRLNPAWEKTLGWTEKELRDRPFLNFIHPDDREKTIAEAQKLATGNNTISFENRYCCRDGSYRWLRWNATPLLEEGLIYCVAHDVTQRKQAEEALQQSEERWQLALWGANDGIWDWNVQTNEVFFSARWKAMLGFEEDEISDCLEEWDKRLHPNDRDRIYRTIQEHLEGKTPFYRTEHRIRCKDSSYKWILDRGKAIWDKNGQAMRMVGSHTDISDRKRKEEILRNIALGVSAATGTAFFQSLVEYLTKALGVEYAFVGESIAPGRIKTLAGYSDGRVIENFEYDLAGTPCERVVGKELTIYTHQIQHEFPLDSILKNMAAESYAGSPLFDSAGSPTGLIAVISRQPFTETKFLEEILTIFTARATAELERQRAEAELRWKEALLRSMAEASPLAFYVVDNRTDVILYSNPRFCQLWGIQHLEAAMERGELKNGDIISECLQNIEDVPSFIESCKPLQRIEDRSVIEDEISFKDGRILRRFSTQIRNEREQYFGRLYIFEDISERKRFEIALRESEARYRLLADHSTDLISTHTPKGIYLYASPACYALLGYKPEELIGKSMYDFFHPDDAAALQRTAHAIAQFPDRYTHTYRARDKYGKYVWLESTNQAIRNPETHAVQTIVVVSRDITQRKQIELEIAQLNQELESKVVERTVQLTQELEERQRAEIALRESEQRYATLTEVSPVGLFHTNVFGNCLYVNERWCKIAGMTLEQATGQGWGNAIHPQDRERVYREWHRAVQNNRPFQLEYRFQRPDGVVTWVFGQAVTETNADGKIVGFVGTITDISARKQAEAIVLESERRWRTLLENVRMLVVALKRDGTIEYANPFLLELTGYTASEVVGQNWFEIFIPRTQQPKMRQIFANIMNRESYPYHQNTILTRSGEEKAIAWNNTLLQDIQGEPMGMTSIGEDITERHAIERMKDEFISVVSHELRTPLTSIHGALNLLSTGLVKPESERGQHVITIASESSERLTRLVNDILELERLESGKIQLSPEWFNAAEVVCQATEQIQVMANRAEIELAVTVPEIELYLDRDRLLQVLTNLLSNAIKFSPNGSTVELTAAPTDPSPIPQIHFCVQDCGRGIPPEKLDSIFERFHQVDASDSRQKGGTGLGLAICRSIVEQHGGTIGVESTLSKGSHFYFTLPQHLEENSDDP
ncbi:PAS domain S-box protein [Lusitaniella coriacea]|uniref:PAS domain S-box protein n=1 Tax=Lusitaniella coriacea TaxID=1983105 RepID=UPI003CF60606